MTRRTLRSVNLSRREQMELDLLLSLVGEQEGDQWQLVNRIGADAAIVDADAETAGQSIVEARRAEEVVITLSQSGGDGEGLCLARPLRSQALVQVLERALQRAAAGGRGEASAYRLRRWPGTDMLRSEWRLTRVCGALGRGPQTMSDIATRTSIEESELRDLLQVLTGAGCVERTAGSARTRERASWTPPSGLFHRLRARLGRA